MIDFPNHSRSYDSTRRAVRFWGHDSAIEASFFIKEDALTRIQPDVALVQTLLGYRIPVCPFETKVETRTELVTNP
jgi:Protein of unknown function (DUF1488)